MSATSRARQRKTIGWTRTKRTCLHPAKLPPFNVTEFQDQAHRANKLTLTKKTRGAFGNRKQKAEVAA